MRPTSGRRDAWQPSLPTSATSTREGHDANTGQPAGPTTQLTPTSSLNSVRRPTVASRSYVLASLRALHLDPTRLRRRAPPPGRHPESTAPPAPNQPPTRRTSRLTTHCSFRDAARRRRRQRPPDQRGPAPARSTSTFRGSVNHAASAGVEPLSPATPEPGRHLGSVGQPSTTLSTATAKSAATLTTAFSMSSSSSASSSSPHAANDVSTVAATTKLPNFFVHRDQPSQLLRWHHPVAGSGSGAADVPVPGQTGGVPAGPGWRPDAPLRRHPVDRGNRLKLSRSTRRSPRCVPAKRCGWPPRARSRVAALLDPAVKGRWGAARLAHAHMRR